MNALCTKNGVMGNVNTKDGAMEHLDSTKPTDEDKKWLADKCTEDFEFFLNEHFKQLSHRRRSGLRWKLCGRSGTCQVIFNHGTITLELTSNIYG